MFVMAFCFKELIVAFAWLESLKFHVEMILAIVVTFHYFTCWRVPSSKFPWTSSFDHSNKRQMSRAGTSNYIPQCLWDVIICLCSWYILLAQHSWFHGSFYWHFSWRFTKLEPMFVLIIYGHVINQMWAWTIYVNKRWRFVGRGIST